MTAHTHIRRRSTDGFTMIEMNVVLIVLALAMAAIFPAIGNLLRGSSRGAASAQATGDSALVAKFLEEDVRTALGNRGTGERSDAASGTTVATIPALATGSVAAVDIVEAGPLRLVVNADVVADAGVTQVERIEWSLTQNNTAICGETDAGGNNWCLRRIVRSAAGGVLASEVVTKSRGTYPAVATCGGINVSSVRVFCYEEAYPGAGGAGNYVWNGGWTSSCNEAWTMDGASPNTGTRTLGSATRYTTRHNAVDPNGSTSISRLDRIVTVGATIMSGGGFGKAGERSYDHVEIAIRSRENEAYREAIMCGLRAGWGR
jgi:prepilin-type N-terminal cleavage/methylation domain-containing protein